METSKSQYRYPCQCRSGLRLLARLARLAAKQQQAAAKT
jgi:hypothetical protein